MMNAPLRTTLLGALALTTLLPTTGCDMVGPLVLQSNEGFTLLYQDLAREWLRWAMITPHSTSPIGDETGEYCNLNQAGQGEPWFLAGTYGGPAERHCTIPAHTPLFFPLVNRWCIATEQQAIDAFGSMDDYLIWAKDYQATGRDHTCGLTLRVDGEDLLDDTEALDFELYVNILEPFAVELDDDNFAGVAGGVYDSTLIDGHWALFKKLEPGDHVLEFGAEICDEPNLVSWETSVTYYLHVEGEPDDDDED